MIRGLEPGRRVALLISECQRGVIEAERSDFPGLVEQVGTRQVVERTAALVDAFRAAGQRVVHVLVAHQPDYADLPITNVIMARSKKKGGMRLGSIDAEPVNGLKPRVGDLVHVRGYSLIGFHGTDLDTRLRNMGIQTLVFAGVSTNVAISGMSMCASDLGYQAIVAEDCIAGASAETHEFIVRNLLPLYSTVTDSRRIAEALATGREV
jgi:nicotinamidase-related amidase